MRLLSVSIPVIWLMIFSVAADMELESVYDHEAELNRILNTRIELLNQSYYENSDVEKELKEILEEPLLSQDLDNLEINKDTELERVTGFDIIEYQMLSRDSGGAVIRAVIKWETENESREICEYTVVLQYSSEGKVKMSGFYKEAEYGAELAYDGSTDPS